MRAIPVQTPIMMWYFVDNDCGDEAEDGKDDDLVEGVFPKFNEVRVRLVDVDDGDVVNFAVVDVAALITTSTIVISLTGRTNNEPYLCAVFAVVLLWMKYNYWEI